MEPIIQISLDLTNIVEALDVARAAMRAGVIALVLLGILALIVLF